MICHCFRGEDVIGVTMIVILVAVFIGLVVMELKRR